MDGIISYSDNILFISGLLHERLIIIKSSSSIFGIITASFKSIEERDSFCEIIADLLSIELCRTGIIYYANNFNQNYCRMFVHPSYNKFDMIHIPYNSIWYNGIFNSTSWMYVRAEDNGASTKNSQVQIHWI